ncbi:MAG: galactokinase, partial [Solirubrobacteraceae bacterium]|nr:galactokinase [Solirubrobacteraceae bacterium]
FAIDRGVTVRATPLPGPLVMAHAVDLREQEVLDTAQPSHAATGWRAFVHGTVAELSAAGHPVRAARLEIRGDVPRGGGLSSSAALGCALALALLGVAGVEDPDRRALAALCSRVENDWVGAPTGRLDQYAALLSQPGEALRIDFAFDTLDRVPMALGDWRLAVVRAGSRTLAGSAYADRRAECAEAAGRLGVHTLRWAERDAADDLPEPYRSRALHVVDENARVEAAVAALAAGDLPALGAILDASHASLRDAFEVSTPAAEAVRDRLRVAGSRLIGGGFGGHLLCLVEPGAELPRGAREVTPSAGASLRV